MIYLSVSCRSVQPQGPRKARAGSNVGALSQWVPTAGGSGTCPGNLIFSRGGAPQPPWAACPTAWPSSQKNKNKKSKKSAEALNGSDVYKLLVHCEHVQEGYKTPECLLKMPMRKKGGWAKSSKGIKQLRNLHWLSMRRCKSILKSSPEFLCHLHGFERVIFDCYHILQNLQPGWKNLQRKWDASKMKMKEMNCREMSSELFQKFLPFHCVLSKNLYQMEPLSIHIILTFIWHEAD